MSIPEHRQAIDKLDPQIVRLLNERTKHVLEIGAIKLRARRGDLRAAPRTARSWSGFAA